MRYGRNLALFVTAGTAALWLGCGSVEESGDADGSPPNGDAGEDADSGSAGCAPDTTTCESGQEIHCDGDGQVAETIDCPLGCHDEEPRCSDLDPSNNLASQLDDAAGAPDVTLSGAATIDTDAGTITDENGSVSPPTETLEGGLPVGLFVVKVNSLTADSIEVVGSRALAIVSNGDIVLNGVLSVSAERDVSGPGAIESCRAESGESAQDNTASGGGGGGFGTAGGAGGNAPGLSGGGGGSATGNPELEPLRGGCPGGHHGSSGLDEDPDIADPGGAGGAVQLVSRTAIEIAESAFVTAHGAGGKGYTGFGQIACLANTPCGNGQGGGSGGGILLEAPVVDIGSTGGLVANGGAGACNIQGLAASGQNSDQPAGGQDCTGGTGDSGDGAAGTTAATGGGNGTGDTAVGGGGGGGAGRIRVNLPSGTSFEPPSDAVVSPPASVGILGTR